MLTQRLEILVRIGELVEDDFDHSTIQNMRLTCWQLNNAISHLLLRYVTVELDQQSLSRLVEISQHPTIRQGVRIIEISLLSYSSVLASSFQGFVHFFSERLSDMITHHETMTLIPDPGEGQPTVVNNRILEARHVLWGYWTDNTDLDEEDLQTPLGQAYNRYQELCVEQVDLLQGASFVRTVAAALARMPLMNNLQFNDHQHDCDFWLSENPNVEEALVDLSLLPISWKTASIFHLGTPPSINLLLTLPGAMYRAQCSPLQRLEIRLSRPEDLLFLEAIAGQDLRDLSNMVQNLKDFSLLPVDKDYVYHQQQLPRKSEILGTFVSAILNTNSLESLSLNLGYRREFDPAEDQQSISFTSTIKPRTWNNLSRLHLDAFPLHVHELGHFLNGLPTNIYHLSLENIRLLSGTWAEALEVLRSKRYHSITVSNPYGNETDDVWMNDYGMFYDVFDNGKIGHLGLCNADAYVMQHLEHNPLKRENWSLVEAVAGEGVAAEEAWKELEEDNIIVLL